MSDRFATRHSKALLASTAALALTITTLTTAPAAYAEPRPTTVIATGLDNPRQLSIGPGDRIYVAEAGRGGDGACTTGAEGTVCFGHSGAITEINGKRQSRVLTGLPSVANQDGSGAQGPADVDVRGANVAILFGLGLTSEQRTGLGPDAATLGTIQTGRLRTAELTTAADLAAWERDQNPDGLEEHSNPTGFLARDSSNWAVADAGANAVLGAGKRGSSTIAVFPANRGHQSVLTDVVKGPDGAYYVSELTGVPFPKGASVIWRVVPGEQPTEYATGLTNVTSLAFKGNQLYAVQLADNGLFAGPTGSVRKVSAGGNSHDAVVDGLFAPFGIAIRGNDAYVTTGAMVPGAGQVQHIALR